MPSPNAVPKPNNASERRGCTSAIRVQKSRLGRVLSIAAPAVVSSLNSRSFPSSSLRRAVASAQPVFGGEVPDAERLFGDSGGFLRLRMNIYRDRPDGRERQFPDPGGAAAMAAVIDRFVDRCLIAAIEPVIVGQVGRAVIGDPGRIARMAIVADALVLEELGTALDGGGILPDVCSGKGCRR